MNPPIHITEQAVTQIKDIISSKKLSKDYVLRIFVDGFGGCGTLKHNLGFDKAKATDESFVMAGISCVYEKKQLLYLIGMVLDYQDREEEVGFFFEKKNIASK